MHSCCRVCLNFLGEGCYWAKARLQLQEQRLPAAVTPSHAQPERVTGAIVPPRRMWQARRCSHRGCQCSGNTAGSGVGVRLRGTAGHRQQDLWLAVALAGLASIHAPPAGAQNPTNTMQRYYLNSTDPLAICNDGSSGAHCPPLLLGLTAGG